MPPRIIKTTQTKIKVKRKRQAKQKLSPATVFLLLVLPQIFYLTALPQFLRKLIILYLIITNILTALRFWQDKSFAIGRTRRIPESELHILEALGGWPASYIAQRWFKHKVWSRHYQAVFWAIVGFHEVLWLSWVRLWVLGLFGVGQGRGAVKAEGMDWNWQRICTGFVRIGELLLGGLVAYGVLGEDWGRQ